MDGFARRKEQSKEEIRKAAWELFSQFGVDRVNMTDIARKAGVSQVTIYNNFGRKEALAREFVTAAVEQLTERFQTILTSKRPYREKMAAFIQSIADMIGAGRPAAADNAVLTSSPDLQNDPEIKRIRTEAQAKMTSWMLALVEEGRQQGQVNPDLSPEALSVYFGVLMEVFVSPELQRRLYQHPELVRELGALIMYGLSKGPRQAAAGRRKAG